MSRAYTSYARACLVCRPIHDAGENDHVEIARLLLSYGADPTLATYSGRSPLKIARSKRMREFLEGYFADSTGFDCGTPPQPWQFSAPSCDLDAAPAEDGYDIFQDMPSDDEPTADKVCQPTSLRDVLHVQISDRKPPLVYSVEDSKTKEIIQMYSLCDVLNNRTLTKDELLRLQPDVTIKKFSWSDVARRSLGDDGRDGDGRDGDGDDDSRTSEKEAKVEFVCLDERLLHLMGVENVS
ncbi:PREDICTED: BCL-6 corepressor-like [Priapulus caudatus]|uniref:BCL-6 corepressor-like n=1 Tax=Priapulus caudatus TaxID=37621 RepID=A0ABM1EK26_PRICU|nr:PREDICTED: BCL-6 corepressor-like [Priapulus caudatus]